MAKHCGVLIGMTFLAMATFGCEGAGKGLGSQGGGTGGSSSGGTTAGGAGGSPSGGTTAGGTCNGAAPCGGALDGTWQIDSMCIQGDFASAMSAQVGLPAACSGVVQSVSIDAVSGTLTYSAGTETANMTMTMKAEFLYTQACVNALPGMTGTLDSSRCASFQQSILSSGQYSSVTCSYSSAGCRCVETADRPSTNATPYTVSGNNIVYSDGSDPMGYCVSGSTLTERQTPSDTPGITMVATFHRAP